jgi:hypothetical protein
MQKIRVRVTYELEIPDDWKILSPAEDEMKHLKINGRFYLPDLMWMEYKGKDADGHEGWEGADDKIEELIGDHIRCGIEPSIRRIKRFSFEED